MSSATRRFVPNGAPCVYRYQPTQPANRQKGQIQMASTGTSRSRGKKEEETSNEVAVPDAPAYPITALATGDDTMTLSEILTENLGHSGITPFDLDRVKVPAGGGMAWELPSLTGEPDVARAFEGIIVAWRETRSYWKSSLDDSGGGNPPDCSSADNVTGIGDPGGECDRCPFSQFGSAKDGRGQKCKQMRLLFVVREGALLPTALFAPPTSIGPIRKYFLRLASSNKRYSDVVTQFSLTKKTSGGGVDYAQIDANVARQLNPQECAAVREYSRGISGALTTVNITATPEEAGDA